MELTRGAGRLARSAALGGAAVALACVAHVGAGGTAPSLGVLAVSVLLTTLVSAMFAGRQLGRLKTLGLLGAMQAALHTAFTCLTHPAPMDTYSHGPPCHVHLTALGALPADAGMPPMDMSPTMILMHASATCTLALVLAHGEALLWSLAAFFGCRLPHRPAVVRMPWRPVPALPPPLHTQQAIDPVPSRRGPPRVAFS